MATGSQVQIQEPEVTFEELAQSARKLRKPLLQIPVFQAEKALKFMTPRVGVRVAETVGTLTGDMQFGPYNEDREDNQDVTSTLSTDLATSGASQAFFQTTKSGALTSTNSSHSG